ncbi:type VII secretion protein EccE [Streptomyces sp.]
MSSATRTRHGGRQAAQQGQQDQRRGPATQQAPATRTSPVAPRLRTRSGSVGPVRVQQLVFIELAAALLLVGWVIHPIALGVTAVAAIALLFFGLGRRRKRPMPEWMATVQAMKRRKKECSDPAPHGTDPAFVPAVECDPALRTYAYADRDERTVGFVGDGTFLTAIVQVEAPDEPLRPQRGTRPLPLDLLHAALDVEDIHLESVQLVQYTQPAPAPHVPEQAVSVRSYAPLQAQSQTPAVRLTWVALKLDPELCAEAVQARGGGIGGAQRALLRATDQLASRLTGLGFRASVLDEREIVTAVGIASCINPRANNAASQNGRAARRTQESVRAWRCDDRWHTTYWVGSWPQLGPGAVQLADLAALLTATPVMATTFALTASRGALSSPAMSGYVRLAARSENELVAARRDLERRSGAARAGLVRLDREQLPGLLATLPLGGTR